jgi:hypothetical protein
MDFKRRLLQRGIKREEKLPVHISDDGSIDDDITTEKKQHDERKIWAITTFRMMCVILAMCAGGGAIVNLPEARRTEKTTASLDGRFKGGTAGAMEQRSDKKKVSLVVGFWAGLDDETHHPHRAEVEAALLANLENKQFDQIVVILDSVTENANCQHFVKRMNRLPEGGKPVSNIALTCINRVENQPNYFEMFNYTLHPDVIGDIVVMSNADQAFDDTIELARHVTHDAVLVLSTQGYNASTVPARLRKHYLASMPHDTTTTKEIVVEGHCAVLKFRSGTGEISQLSYSWDTYIYDKNYIRDTLTSVAFKRKTYERNWVSFFMNENGAENAALHGLTHKLSNIKIWNVCHLIHSYHFHLAPKTHRKDARIWPPKLTSWLPVYDRPTIGVPGPTVNPPMCYTREQCKEAFQ